jgi:hypothetical protein
MGDDDDDVFFYGMGVEDLEGCVEDGENTALDFVVTSFSEI